MFRKAVRVQCAPLAALSPDIYVAAAAAEYIHLPRPPARPTTMRRSLVLHVEQSPFFTVPGFGMGSNLSERGIATSDLKKMEGGLSE